MNNDLINELRSFIAQQASDMKKISSNMKKMSSLIIKQSEEISQLTLEIKCIKQSVEVLVNNQPLNDIMGKQDVQIINLEELKEQLKKKHPRAKFQTLRYYNLLLKKYSTLYPGIPTQENINQFIEHLEHIKWQNSGAVKVVTDLISQIYNINYEYKFHKSEPQQRKVQRSLSQEERKLILNNAQKNNDEKFIDYFHLLSGTAFRISDLWPLRYKDIDQDWIARFVSPKTSKVFLFDFSEEKERIAKIKNEIGETFDPAQKLFAQYFQMGFESFSQTFNEKLKEYSGNRKLSSHSIRKRTMNLLEKQQKGLGIAFTQSNERVFKDHYEDVKVLPLFKDSKKIKKKRKTRYTLKRRRQQ